MAFSNLNLWQYRFFRWLVALFLFLVLLGGAFRLLIPYIVNLKALEVHIVTDLSKHTGLRIDSQRLAIYPTFFHGLEAVFYDTVIDDPTGKHLGKSPKTIIDVRYLPLIFQKKASVSRIRFEKPQLDIEKDSYLFRMKLPETPNPQVYIKNAQLEFQNYTLTFDHDYLIQGKQLTLSHFRSLGALLLSGQGQVFWQRSSLGQFQLETKTSQDILAHSALDLNNLYSVKLKWHMLSLQTLSRYLKAQGIAFDGQGMLDRLGFTLYGKGLVKLMLLEGLSKKPVKLTLNGQPLVLDPWHFTAKSRLQFTAQQTLASIDQVDTQILVNKQSRPIHVQGEFDVLHQMLNGHVYFHDLNLQWLDRFLSQFKTLPVKFKDVPIAGSINADMGLSGKLQSPAIQGQLQVNHLAIGDAQNQLLTDMNGLLKFNNKTVRLKRVSGSMGGGPVVMDGTLDTAFKNSHIHLVATQVNLKPVCNSLSYFQPSLASLIDIQGKSDINLMLTGTLNKPDYTGVMAAKGVSLVYKPTGLNINNVVGLINIDQQSFSTKQLQGLFQQIPCVASGNMSKNKTPYHIAMSAKQVPALKLQQAIVTAFPNTNGAFQSAGLQAGLVDVNLIVASDIPGNLGGTLAVSQLAAIPSGLTTPFLVSQGQYNFQSGQLLLPSNAVKFGPYTFKATGYVKAKDYNVQLLSQHIPIETFSTEKLFWNNLLHLQLPTLYRTQGVIQLGAKITPQSKTAKIKFLNAGFSTPSLRFPLYHINGEINAALSKKLKVNTDNLTLRYANSPVKISLNMNGLQDVYLEAVGTLSPLLINELPIFQNATVVAYTAMPFEIKMTGKVGQFWGKGLGNDLNLFCNVNVASLFNDPKLATPSEAGGASLDQALLSSVFHLKGDTVTVEDTEFRSGPQSAIVVAGQVDNLFNDAKRHSQLSIKTKPALDLAEIAHALNQTITNTLAGKIKADLKVDQLPSYLYTEGTVAFDHVKSDQLSVLDLNGNVNFENNKAHFNIDHFQIPGVDVGFTTTATDMLRYPWPLENFNLTGKQFVVTQYTDWLSNVVTGKLRHDFWEKFFPNTGHVGILPFEILNGNLAIDEGIINNLIVTNYKSNIRLYPNTYFELSKASADSAGGKVLGHFSMNPRDNNFMTVHLRIEKMKANAVSRILLNVTNEIFGDLSGKMDYTTEGISSTDFLANTDGSIALQIENGRLPSVTKVQNLLIAANTISGGLTNLNLNSLFHLADPFKTEYFAKLTGSAKIVEGIIYTDDFLSEGKNLRLTGHGSVRLADGSADMLLHGQMNRAVSGAFGNLGTISVQRFLGILPPLGTLVGHIPLLGFTPGFGGPSNKGVAFEVNLKGLVTDPSSMKNFHWVK